MRHDLRTGKSAGRSTLSASQEGCEPVPSWRTGSPVASRPGLLACRCWCEARTFYIPEDWVREGKTASCGPACEP